MPAADDKTGAWSWDPKYDSYDYPITAPTARPATRAT